MNARMIKAEFLKLLRAPQRLRDTFILAELLKTPRGLRRGPFARR